jgi:uncharacterized protein (DUF1800 family)
MNRPDPLSIDQHASRNEFAHGVDEIDPTWAWQVYVPNDEMPWTRRRAAHLLRRAGFGYRWDDLEQVYELGPTTGVDQLFDLTVNHTFDQQMAATGAAVASRQEPRQLSIWWLLQMAQVPNSMLEKLTFFWHGHFATGADKVRDNRALFSQNQHLRRLALGSFTELVNEIARDPAMLIYLDTTDNRKTRPNENFARELLELFCLGPGNYTEQDIQQLARCFTGWEVRAGRFHFNPHQHDDGSKTIFGRQHAFDATEAIAHVVKHPACAPFIVRKLIRYYVADEMELPDQLVEPLAETFRSNNNSVHSVVETILRSNLFFSQQSIGAKIRSPVELAVFLLRMLQINYKMEPLASQLESMGQLPYFPPNVKGWEGGRTWINAATLLGRNQLARNLVQTATANAKLLRRLIPNEITKSDSDEFVKRVVECWLAVDLSAEIKSLLFEVAERYRHQPQRRITETLKLLVSLPEFQLG